MTKIVSSTGKVTRDDLKNDRVKESRAKEVKQLSFSDCEGSVPEDVRKELGLPKALFESYEVYKIHAQDYKRLLGHVLNALDASLPNKQQHAAATRMVRNHFDKTYYQMMQLTSPDVGFGQIEGCYAVEPVR